MYTPTPAALPAGLTYTAPADATSGGTLAGPPTEETAATYTLTATKGNMDNVNQLPYAHWSRRPGLGV